MADITITAANVIAGAGAKIAKGVAGETIAAGKSVAQAADGTYMLADCDSATAALRMPKGIALNGASDGQPLSVLTEGPITIGGTVTAGTVYFLSPTAGGICPVGDLSTGDYPTVLGIARSTAELLIGILPSGVAL